MIFLLGVSSISAQISPVIISEVFYDSPLNETLSGRFSLYDVYDKTHHNGEFIEFFNPSSKDIDISGWTVQDYSTSSYRFPANSIIPSRGMVVLAYRYPNSNFNLSDLFPSIPLLSQGYIYYHCKFLLDNDGEEIKLLDTSGQVVDKMSYRYRSKKTKSMRTAFWDICAHNGKDKDKDQLVSLQRVDIHSGSSGISPLASDFKTLKATPFDLPSNINFPVIGTIFNNTSVDTSLPVGSLPGQASVSPSGAANYKIPIEVPPGTNNLQPQISVIYSSQAGSGVLGQGWDVSCGSSITRIPQNLYYDAVNGKVGSTNIEFTNSDCLTLDGQRLILLSGQNLSAGAEYGTEVENFARVKIVNSAVTGSISFVVTSKDGQTIEYGNTVDSRLTNAQSTTDNRVLAWKINRITDVNQNYMDYNYIDKWSIY
jgi:hypothetical protein